MATSNSIDPYQKIDELIALIGELENDLQLHCAGINKQHSAIDKAASERTNSLLAAIQASMDELKRLADAHRGEILPHDKKSTKRNTGVIGWRSEPRIKKFVSDEELIGRIRGMGLAYYRKFVRRTVRYDLNNDALVKLAFRADVAAIDGLELDLGEDFYVKPNAGLRLSSGKRLWPNLQGLPVPFIQNALIGSGSGSSPD